MCDSRYGAGILLSLVGLFNVHIRLLFGLQHGKVMKTKASGRSKMELMIKDHKVALASDCTSCLRKEANQFRLFLHSAAYVLMQAIRAQWLQGTSLATAQFDTIRLALLKLGGESRCSYTGLAVSFAGQLPISRCLWPFDAGGGCVRLSAGHGGPPRLENKGERGLVSKNGVFDVGCVFHDQ